MELTIEITNYCENECDYCSSNASKSGKHLSYDEIEKFIHKNLENVIHRINISGGEPLSHPDFYKILLLCKKHTRSVWVYTNALEKIIYNSDVIKEIEVESNVCLIPGKSVYIPRNVSKVHLLQLVRQGRAKDMEPGNYHVSSNITMSNDCDHNCDNCNHKLLQADGKIVEAPCKKDY